MSNPSAALSDPVKEGLRHLGTSIPLEISRELIANCVKHILNTEANIPPVPDLYAHNSLKAKQSEYAVVALYSVAIKHSLSTMSFRQLLEDSGVAAAAIEELANTYEEQKKSLILRHLQIGNSFPHVTDIQWRIVADVKSSTSESSSGEVGFCLNLGCFKQHPEGERETVAEFVCNTEELQLLINKLKEIERHCEKMASHD